MITSEYQQITIKQITTNQPRPAQLGALGNKKLGPIYQFSGLSIHSCPGRTAECEKVCYDAWSPKTFLGGEKLLAKQAWYSYLAEHNPDSLYTQIISEIRVFGTPVIRIHVGGDFMTIEHIQLWIRVLKARPDIKFFAYTRSWRVPELLPYLEELRSLPNMKLFASLDSQTGAPPEGWRWAAMGGTPDLDMSRSAVCPEIAMPERVANCRQCGLCFNDGVQRNIIFPLHGTKGRSAAKRV